jgi:hypothetical protein
VVVLATTVLAAEMLERRWGDVGELISVSVFSAIVMKFVWLPLASRHARRPASRSH